MHRCIGSVLMSVKCSFQAITRVEFLVFSLLASMTFAINYCGLRYGVFMPEFAELTGAATDLTWPCSDLVVDMDYARAVYEKGSVFPQGTCFTTEPRAILTAVIMAFFYGVTGDMQFMAAMSITLLSEMVLLCCYYLLRMAGCSRLSSLWGIAAMSILYVSNVLSYNLLMCSYAQIFLGVFVTLIAYFSRGRGWWFLSLGFAFLMGMQSPRAVAILYLPLLIVDLLLQEEKEKRQIFPLVLALVVNLSSYGVLQAWVLGHYQITVTSPVVPLMMPDRNTLLAVAKEVLGSVSVSPPPHTWAALRIFYDGLLVCTVGTFFFLMSHGLIKGIRSRLLCFCLLSGGLTIAASIALHVAGARYYFTLTWMCIFVLTFFLDAFLKKSDKRALYIGVCILTAGWCLFQGQRFLLQMDWRRTSQEYQAVQIVQRASSEYVYATYWHAGSLEVASDFRIRTGNLLGTGSLGGGDKPRPGSVALRPLLFGTNRGMYTEGEAPRHVVLMLDQWEFDCLDEDGKRIVAQGQFLGRAGELFFWLFEEHPFVLDNAMAN